MKVVIFAFMLADLYPTFTYSCFACCLPVPVIFTLQKQYLIKILKFFLQSF